MSQTTNFALPTVANIDNENYEEQWRIWHADREATLASEYGWLTLTGIQWIAADGETRIEGLPGFWTQTDNKIFYHPDADSAAELKIAVRTSRDNPDSAVTKTVEILPYEAKNPTKLYFNQVQVELVFRDGRYALRTRDPQAPDRQNFQGVDHFSVDTEWKLPAHFVPLAEPESVDLGAVIPGLIHRKKVIGHIVFAYEGNEYSLEVFETNGVSPSLLFRDSTNGESTYGAGRFIYLLTNDLADIDHIDFNLAINPPCYFSEYCTCPVANTRLPFAVTAGEKAQH